MHEENPYLNATYPDARVWSFGDSPAMADDLLNLVINGEKSATCCSMASYSQEDHPVLPGTYHVVLDGRNKPACVIRTIVMRVIRFDEVTENLARLEGEGDKSLTYWRTEHRSFFEREETFSPDMELVFEEFEVIEIL